MHETECHRPRFCGAGGFCIHDAKLPGLFFALNFGQPVMVPFLLTCGWGGCSNSGGLLSLVQFEDETFQSVFARTLPWLEAHCICLGLFRQSGEWSDAYGEGV